MNNFAKALGMMLLTVACSQAKFGNTSKKDDANTSASNLGACGEADKAAGKCTGDGSPGDSGPATDCSDLTRDMCKDKKETEGNANSFRTVNCEAIDAASCAADVKRAIADDGDQQSEIRVVGCREDAAKTCEAIDAMKNGETGEVVLLPKNGDVTSTAGTANAPNFAFLVNDPQCAMCHLRFNGNVVSTSPLKGIRADSEGYVNGNWYAASTWDIRIPAEAASAPGVVPKVNFLSGQVYKNYKGNEIPHTPDGVPAFPEFSSTEAAAKAYGQLNGKNHLGQVVTITAKKSGLVTLVGSIANPIKISGEVFIDGDLIIKGYYQGIGTIYTSGNIYIPGNLRAVTSAFPFDDNADKAFADAKSKMNSKTLYDGLALASQKSIIIADLEHIEPAQVINPTPGTTCTQFNADKQCIRFGAYQRELGTLYAKSFAPAGRDYDSLGILNIYAQVGGKSAYDALYDNGYVCQDVSKLDAMPAVGMIPAVAAVPPFIATGRGGFDMIDAFLYARNTVGGISRRNSYSINGGIIADHMHIISGAGGCRSEEAHPIHKRNQKFSYVNFDYRLRAGLPLMKLMRRYFEPLGDENK